MKILIGCRVWVVLSNSSWLMQFVLSNHTQVSYSLCPNRYSVILRLGLVIVMWIFYQNIRVSICIPLLIFIFLYYLNSVSVLTYLSLKGCFPPDPQCVGVGCALASACCGCARRPIAASSDFLSISNSHPWSRHWPGQKLRSGSLTALVAALQTLEFLLFKNILVCSSSQLWLNLWFRGFGYWMWRDAGI